MDYLEWNDLLARHFFNEENAGKEVLLYVNDVILGEIGKKTDVDDFIQSIKTGPSWTSHSGICQKALQTFENWRCRGLNYPPYISYLACFVLAAGMHGDFAPHAYYPRLRQLLGETDNTSDLLSFGRMLDLWDDLEKWSTEDKHEELGRFTARIRGSWWKVGLPLSQTIFSRDEQKRLPAFFEAANLDPSAPPSQMVVLKLMLYHGSRFFEKKTLKALNTNTGDDIILKNKLIEMVLDELQEWDGAVFVEENSEGRKGKSLPKINTGLRICLRYDPVSGQVSTNLRLKTNNVYPENGLIFKCKNFPGDLFYCEEAYQGWSKKLKKEESYIQEATAFNWTRGVFFCDPDNNWHATLIGNNVRLFIPGKPEGLPDWIETNRLDRGIKFLVAANEVNADTIRNWGKSSCESFEELEVNGLPPRWSFFRGRNASGSCNDIDVLTVSSTVRLLLKGGVKIRGGNTYLYTAPPLIVLENPDGEVSITVNGISLAKKISGMSVWKLPDDIQPNEILRIEAKTGGHTLKRILRLEEPSLSGSFDETPWRNAKGQIISDSCPVKIRGAIVDTTESALPSLAFIYHGSKRLVLIGSIPGQILEYPSSSLSLNWEPIWSIEKKGRKKWKVACCKTNIASITLPDKTARVGKPKNVKRWKEYVWIRRRKIETPDIPLIKEKWLEFSEAARDV